MCSRNRKKSKAVLSIFCLITIIFFCELDKTILTFTSERWKIPERMIGPFSPKDQSLVAFVKENFLERPSKKPTNLHRDQKDDFSVRYTKFSKKGRSTKHINDILKYLYPKDENFEKGVFFEAGALDGEMGSNTLYLELELGWTGVLIEPDLEMYNLLVSKHRNAWTCHCCLSTKPYPFKTTLLKFTQPREHFDAPLSEYRGINFIEEAGLFERLSVGYISYESVQCLPLETILLALNITTINFFSLDIEGSEVDVLREFPWVSVQVDVWTIEHVMKNSSKPETTDEEFIKWFQEKGYDLFDATNFPTDYTFIRKGSDVHKKKFVKNKITKFP